MQPEDDGALLRQYSENQSNGAFATLVARHINLVYSVALRGVADPHHADEVTQAVFIIFAKKAAQLRHDKALSSWLFQTTRFAAANFVRSEIRRHRREQEAYMQSVVNESGGDEVWRQIAPLLDTAVATLNEKDRRAIVLRFYEGRGLREVGAALGSNEESAKKRVARALEKLQRFFSKRGVHSTTTMITGAISANSVHAAPADLAVSVTAAATAKGAAASVSTVALVKGALKIMVWTKTKKMAVTGGLMLILAGIVAFSIFDFWRRSHFPDIQGTWEGTTLLYEFGLRAGEASRTRLVLNLVKTNGTYRATADWIDLGKRGVDMGKVTYDYPYIHIGGDPTWWRWDLRINADGTQMTLDQSIRSIARVPALFLRTSSPDAVPAPLTEEEFAPGGGSGFQGYWEGEVDINANDYWANDEFAPGTDAMQLNLKISEQDKGKFRAEIDSPVWGAKGAPATGSHSGSLVKFSDDVRSGLFQGALNDNGTELIGSLTKGGRSVPAKFKRADYPAEQALAAQKSYSFTSRGDLQGHWKGSWVVTTVKTKPTLHLALDIAKMPDGSYSAALTYLDLFANNYPIPATDFKYDPPNIRLEWKWWKRGYEGTLKNGRLVGVITITGTTRTFPLTFERVDPQ
jgi:RNA polymerase sigma factor (sigma-70 family)